MIGFIVTKDHLDGLNVHGLDIDIIGPRDCTLTHAELLKGHPFRMFDDDDNLYYSGFLVGDKNSDEGFLPLDCYGTPNAGCTSIQYQDKSGNWRTL